MKISGLLFLVACGGSTSDPSTTDGGIIDGDQPADARVIGPGSLVGVALDCMPYSREIRHAATDGSRDVTINSFATVNLPAGSAFVLSICDAPVLIACGGGDVCMGTEGPSATKICDVQVGGARFYDDKLTIACGVRTEHYSATGVLGATTQTTYTVKLEVFQ